MNVFNFLRSNFVCKQRQQAVSSASSYQLPKYLGHGHNMRVIENKHQLTVSTAQYLFFSRAYIHNIATLFLSLQEIEKA